MTCSYSKFIDLQNTTFVPYNIYIYISTTSIYIYDEEQKENKPKRKDRLMEKKHHEYSVHYFFSLLLLFFISLLLLHSEKAEAQNSKGSTVISVNVGVILDMDKWVGQMGLSCISMALSDFYASHSFYKTRLVLNNRDSKNDVVGAAAAGIFYIYILS